MCHAVFFSRCLVLASIGVGFAKTRQKRCEHPMLRLSGVMRTMRIDGAIANTAKKPKMFQSTFDVATSMSSPSTWHLSQRYNHGKNGLGRRLDRHRKFREKKLIEVRLARQELQYASPVPPTTQ